MVTVPEGGPVNPLGAVTVTVTVMGWPTTAGFAEDDRAAIAFALETNWT